MSPANQFTRRVIRTERAALIQIRCARCGFATVGAKESIETLEKEHTTACSGSASPNPRGFTNRARPLHKKPEERLP